MTVYEDTIRELARMRGIDDQIAIDVANSEGGVTQPARCGQFETGSSWWAYQLHYGGKDYPEYGIPEASVAGMGNGFTDTTSWAPGDPDAWRDAARCALDRAKAAGWGDWYGAAAIGVTGFDGIDRDYEWDEASEAWDYQTGELPPHEGKEYSAMQPAFAQNDSWSCMPTSVRWALWAYGREPTEQWIESTMIAEQVVSPEYGCLDASGAGVADFLNRHYGDDGFFAESVEVVGFDELAAEIGALEHPVAVGGRGWYHWSGVRWFDPAQGLLCLANPASGWQGVYQSMTRDQFEQLGPFSMVRLTHPYSEVEPMPPDTTPWQGKVGDGLLTLMGEDNTVPAQRSSTWLPLGASPSDIEECVGENGVTYRWLLSTNVGYRYWPSS